MFYNTKNNEIIIYKKDYDKTILLPINLETQKRMINDYYGVRLTFLIKTFEKLSQYSTLTDIPINKTEYYSFKDKNKTTIKITNRPIYYILDKKDYEKKNYHIKPIGKLEYSHAFKVRGHWRRIDEKSIGKDRNGNYKIEGFTWVIDHIRGQGELVNRVRIVKSTHPTESEEENA